MLSGLAIVIVRKLRATESSYAIFFSQCVVGFWLMLIPANVIPSDISIGEASSAAASSPRPSGSCS
ncbi:hypothetical protein MASR1M66_21330 [Aminivibrio sp.]